MDVLAADDEHREGDNNTTNMRVWLVCIKDRAALICIRGGIVHLLFRIFSASLRPGFYADLI